MAWRENLPWFYPPLLIIFHVDIFIIGLTALKIFPLGVIVVIAAAMATISTIMWYVFWGSVRKFTRNPEDEESGNGFKRGLGRYLSRYEEFLKSDSLRARLIKGGGNSVLFFIGLIPEPGSRVLGFMYCGMIQSKTGLFWLGLGNVLKTIGVAFLANEGMSFFAN
jgi:hypothetical protein